MYGNFFEMTVNQCLVDKCNVKVIFIYTWNWTNNDSDKMDNYNNWLNEANIFLYSQNNHNFINVNIK